jgi:putative transcriptional regulator
MKNSTVLKNELIFQYASGTSSLAKSLMASTYLFLNTSEIKLYNQFEDYCGEELNNVAPVQPTKLTMDDCINNEKKMIKTNKTNNKNPINKFVTSYYDLKWKNIFRGFYEYSIRLSNNENAKLIKMDPGASVPLHSHNGKEYILVLEGSFEDEYGKYTKGDLQINDYEIKHTPVASNKDGCICLTITEKNLIFHGPFAPILNLITYIKSLFFSNN